jgi:hypothetical protein
MGLLYVKKLLVAVVVFDADDDAGNEDKDCPMAD